MHWIALDRSSSRLDRLVSYAIDLKRLSGLLMYLFLVKPALWRRSTRFTPNLSICQLFRTAFQAGESLSQLLRTHHTTHTVVPALTAYRSLSNRAVSNILPVLSSAFVPPRFVLLARLKLVSRSSTPYANSLVKTRPTRSTNGYNVEFSTPPLSLAVAALQLNTRKHSYSSLP